ncbi:PAS domain S-box protein [Haloarcula japonica]|uniref:histidine kinase n=1 Tax=Haloarcula japonica (strain ATCC 49778 / DSM 6131 / JCM 7785 / NBRC 101032 / NCIMB 13157 / TR-1) TaxID=1227453 RepID=M0LEC3_HALJT|nr:PAS domain S-box protein [Haloarcula japonica]EMA31917.1 putative signal-transducing histidine kinase / response regulator [Haloarcula japonica DSM 6131]
MSEDIDTSRLTALFNKSPDAIILVDSDGEILRANERLEEMFGYEPTNLEGESIEVLVPEADRDHHPAQRDSYMENPTTRPMGADLDLRGRRKDGSTFPVDISLSPIETDDDLEVMAAIRDITKRETLRRKYRTVMDAAPDAMFIADAKTGEVLEVNQRALDLMEMSEDELVGRDQTDLHPREDKKRYRELFQRHVDNEEGTVARFSDGEELFVETTSGDRIPIEISAQATELNGDKRVIGVFRDISDRREHERELQRQIARLETLAEVLSHDLRNPLNVAEAGVDLAQETGDLERLEMVETSHTRMESLIDDALTLIQEGYEVESVGPIELASIASDCWQHVQTTNATLQIADEGIIYADSRRVKNLFENLFRNAIEHGGDTVTVRVGVSEDGFFVADDGPGIPADERDDVLEPGWTTAADGTGLGLNIVSEIASAHSWDIDVSESDDGGARFDFTGVKTAVYDDSFDNSTDTSDSSHG